MAVMRPASRPRVRARKPESISQHSVSDITLVCISRSRTGFNHIFASDFVELGTMSQRERDCRFVPVVVVKRNVVAGEVFDVHADLITSDISQEQHGFP